MIIDSIHKRARWLTWLLCGCLAGQFLLTKPLWTSSRWYPLTPLFPWVPPITPPFDQLVFWSLFLLLTGIAFDRKRCRSWMLAFLSVISGLLISDQSRWHPWAYWYSFMMAALAWALPRGQERLPSAFNACRALLVGCYFWAGLQKINVTFFFSVFPWMLTAFDTAGRFQAIWRMVGFLVPVLEASLGLLLLLPRYRRCGVVGLVGMHTTILFVMGPLGHGLNPNIWPWNLGIIFFILILFADSAEVTPGDILIPRSLLHRAAVILFLVLPLFTFFDLWDAYPGFSLYSGSLRAAYIQLDEKSKARLPESVRSVVDGENRLLASRWASLELNTPDYPEKRIHMSLLRFLCDPRQNIEGKAELVLLSKPGRLSGARRVERNLSCGELPANLGK